MFSDLVVASPVEDYFLYIDDLPSPEKVRAYILVAQFACMRLKLCCPFPNTINGRIKLKKLQDQFWKLLVMTIQFVARVQYYFHCFLNTTSFMSP